MFGFFLGDHFAPVVSYRWTARFAPMNKEIFNISTQPITTTFSFVRSPPPTTPPIRAPTPNQIPKCFFIFLVDFLSHLLRRAVSSCPCDFLSCLSFSVASLKPVFPDPPTSLYFISTRVLVGSHPPVRILGCSLSCTST